MGVSRIGLPRLFVLCLELGIGIGNGNRSWWMGFKCSALHIAKAQEVYVFLHQYQMSMSTKLTF